MIKQNNESADQDYLTVLDGYDPLPTFLRAFNLDAIIDQEACEIDSDILVIKGKLDLKVDSKP
jgi:hypothetical protein